MAVKGEKTFAGKSKVDFRRTGPQDKIPVGGGPKESGPASTHF